MKPPLYVRPLTVTEHQQLEAARRSSHVFRMRRAQIVLASARGQSAKPLAPLLGCSVQTIRHVIRAFNGGGLRCLAKRSNRPKSAKPTLGAAPCAPLRHLRHQSPRRLGKPTGLWTLALAAQGCHEQGLTGRPRSDETIRRAIKRLGASWKRAKHWITSPDPQYARKKSAVLGSDDWPTGPPRG
jgi:transposase